MINPPIIVCSQTQKLVHSDSFNVTGYKMYYNKSYINQNDGPVVHISDYITEMTEIIYINNLQIKNFKIGIKTIEK